MLTAQSINSHPHPVMAGLEPAIQASPSAIEWLMDWMAASRAAMPRKSED
jgi:hypothetical protein